MLTFGLAFGLYVPTYIDQSLKDSAVVCAQHDSDYGDWQDTFGKDSIAKSYEMYYLYDMKNPEAFLNGETAELHELGPFAQRWYKTRLDVEFIDDNGAASVNYLRFDRYEADEAVSCDDCKDNTTTTNLNPAYLTLMTSSGNEGLVFLAASCSEIQIANIAGMEAGTAAPCSASEMGDPTATTCACCIPAGVDVPEGATSCASLYADDSITMALFSLGAEMDGGVMVRNGTTALGQQGVFSELVVSKTAHEWMYGFPNALVGYLSGSQMAAGGDAALNETAVYTNQVAEVCGSTCSGALLSSSCAGFAPHADQLSDKPDVAFLADINCAPYTITYLTTQLCMLANPLLGGTACRCTGAAAGSDLPPAGCCLAEGEVVYKGDPLHLGLPDIELPLAGFGCLVEIPGYLSGTERAYKDEQAFRDHGPGMYTERTGCDDAQYAMYETQFNGIRAYPMWVVPEGIEGDDWYPESVPTPAQIAQFTATAGQVPAPAYVYVADVGGGQGTQYPPTGLSAGRWSNKITDGSRYNDSYLVYIEEVLRPLELQFIRDSDVGGVDTHRYEAPDAELLDFSVENSLMGASVPMNGTQCFSYPSGFQAYIARPNFMYGDDRLLSQMDNSDKFVPDGAGIEVYQAIDFSTGASWPTPVLLTPELLRSDQALRDYDTYIDIEPATGKALKGHKRLMGVFAVYGCDPKLDATCGLFPQIPVNGSTTAASVGKGGICYATDPNLTGAPYGCSAANVLAPNVMGEKLIPSYWADETASATDSDLDELKTAATMNVASGYILVLASVMGGLLCVMATATLVHINREEEEHKRHGDRYLEGALHHKLDDDQHDHLDPLLPPGHDHHHNGAVQA